MEISKTIKSTYLANILRETLDIDIWKTRDKKPFYTQSLR